MDLDPSACWDCPTPLPVVLGLAGVVLFSLWAGLRLSLIPGPWAHWTGLMLRTLSGMMTYVLLITVWRDGISWSGRDSWTSPRHRGLDTLFLIAVFVLDTILILRFRTKSMKVDAPAAAEKSKRKVRR